MQLNMLCVQLNLNFKWFSVTSVTSCFFMLWNGWLFNFDFMSPNYQIATPSIPREYLVHLKTNLNIFLWLWMHKLRMTKSFWSLKTIGQWPKILSSKSQIDFINANYQIVTPSIPMGISYSFKNQFKEFLWLWMHLVKDYNLFEC